MKKKTPLLLVLMVLTFTSCGSILDGLASIYGEGYGGGAYNPYANMWNSASTGVTVPAALDPVNAANAAAAAINNNMQSQMKGMWENAAKEEQQRQQMLEATAKDMWEHPERYQNIPVQGGDAAGGASTNGASTGGTSTSGGASGHQCRLCGGSGRKISQIHPGDASQTKWCSECNKSVHTGHFHTRCDLCGGSGWIK